MWHSVIQKVTKPPDAHVSQVEPLGNWRHPNLLERERKDASAVESESGLIPECFGTIRASVVPQGWRRSVGFARWSNAPLLPARQTEDECREDQLQTGIATSIKRQPRWFTQLRLRPNCVETSGSCVRQDAANPTKGPVNKPYSQVPFPRA